MIISRTILIFISATSLYFLGGCKNNPREVASPSCAEIETISDQEQKDALIKKCPRYSPKTPTVAPEPLVSIPSEIPEPPKQKSLTQKRQIKPKHGSGFKHSQMKQW